jgi:hypothetical protein
MRDLDGARHVDSPLYLLGEQDRIVGVSGYAVRPPQVRREKPRVSAFTSADIPKISVQFGWSASFQIRSKSSAERSVPLDNGRTVSFLRSDRLRLPLHMLRLHFRSVLPHIRVGVDFHPSAASEELICSWDSVG